MTWVPLSLLAGLSLAVHSLAMAKLTKNGFDLGRINLNVFFLVFIFVGLQQVLSGNGYKLPNSQLIYVFIAAVGAFAIIHFSLMAIAIAPNPGYVSGLTSLSVVVVAIASIFLFDAHFSISKFLGIALCLLGIYLIGR
ncbi:MAG: EamA family transporter [Nitrospirota bacterium]|nr:EamA family transporter [Nitrospirota bacterium]